MKHNSPHFPKNRYLDGTELREKGNYQPHIGVKGDMMG